MDKYYTPDISDIFVGYECLTERHKEEWFPDKLTATDIYNFREHPDRVRTPYLTKEQIEKEGWEITSREIKAAPYKVDWVNAKKGDSKLWINLALKVMFLGVDGRNGIIYRGSCPSINEFRKICKLLGI